MALWTEYEACFVEMVGGLWQRFWFEFFLWFFPLLLEQSRDDFSNHVFLMVYLCLPLISLFGIMN